METKILHLLTGGTIEGCVPECPEIEKFSEIFGDNIDIPKYIIHSLKVAAIYTALRVCKKDSRDLNFQDRKKMVGTIKNAFREDIKRILITHGTYTMPETGIYLINNLQEKVLAEVSIVITGSILPPNITGSDALLNIGAAISNLLNTSEPFGVKINMHGKNWDPRKIKKNTQDLIFEEC